MNPTGTQNLFGPIDQGQQGWQDELNRRNQINSQIDFLNQLAQQNQRNPNMQKALLDQYMGLVSPPQSDPNSDLARALQLMTSGQSLNNPRLSAVGQSMLQQNPLISQYMGQSGTDQSANPAQNGISDLYLKKFLADFATQDKSGNTKPLDNSTLEQNINALNAVQNDPSLARQYYNQSVNPMGVLGYTFGHDYGANPLNAMGGMLGNLMGGADRQLRLANTFGGK